MLTRFNAILGALFGPVLVTGSFADGLFGVVLVVNSWSRRPGTLASGEPRSHRR